MPHQTTRRKFIAAAGSTPVILSTSISLRSMTRAAANDRINIAMIGCGKMAFGYHIPELLKQPDVQVVAVCEVDKTRREHAQERVNKHYSSSKKEYKGCDGVFDYRELIERDDIDAVCIATPDHWHAIPIIAACKAGKDIYCEKPLTLTIREAELCVQAARKYKRVVQTGSQQRSNVFGRFREAVEIIRSGRLGKISKVTIGVGAPSVPCDLPEEKMEPGLEWNHWLGPAPQRPYNSILSPRGIHHHFPQWRKYIEYSGGAHTDMGAHFYDIAQWALDRDDTGPIEVIPPDKENSTSGTRYIYEDGIELIHGGPSGCVFYGENGKLHIGRGVLKSDPEEIVGTALGEDDIRLPKSPGHHRNWLDCIKSRKKPVADVEAGARTVTIAHLGNLAYRHHRSFKFNPETWKFENEKDNELLERERRDPWQLPEF